MLVCIIFFTNYKIDQKQNDTINEISYKLYLKFDLFQYSLNSI